MENFIFVQWIFGEILSLTLQLFKFRVFDFNADILLKYHLNQSLRVVSKPSFPVLIDLMI